MEAKVAAKRLNCERGKNFETIPRFSHVFEHNEKMSLAKSNNEWITEQLKALLEKYEQLKRHVDTIKERFLEERTERKRYQKELKRVNVLIENQAVLKEKAEAAYKKKMEKEHKKYVWTLQRCDEERSALTTKYKNLKMQLHIYQVENQKLQQVIQAKELEKMRAENHLQQSQKLVTDLYKELDESKTQRESCNKQLEAMKTQLMKAQNDLQCLQESDTASKREGKLREAVSLLERERKLLLEEMEDLRKDYFRLSDRISQRLEQLEQTEGALCITDISYDHHTRTPKEDKRGGQSPSSMDMIEHIRRKLESEDMQQR